MYPSPYRIDIYNVNRALVGNLANPIWITANPRHNEVSTLEFALPTTHDKLPLLMEKGARVILYRNGGFVMSGAVDVISGQGPTFSGIITISVVGDLAIAQNVLGWMNPDELAWEQVDEYWEMTGPLESVVKAVFTQNAVTRLGMDINVMPDLGRGPTITFKSKMEPLSELFFPLVDQHNWGVQIYQLESEMYFDVYQCTTFPMVLSEASGVVQSWSFSSAAPTATHILMGGSTPAADPEVEGDEPMRWYHPEENTTRAAAWGIKEIYIDGSDLPATDDEDYWDRAQDALDVAMAEHNETSGITLSLSETENFHYGPGGIQVGQLVTVELGVATRTDVLRECVLTFTYEDGDRAVPTVGEVSDDPDRSLAKFLRKMRRSINEIRLAR